mgnify:CR=1 FL=1
MGYLNYVRQIQVKVHKRDPNCCFPGHRARVLKLTAIQQPVKHGLISPLILWSVKKEPRYFSPMYCHPYILVPLTTTTKKHQRSYLDTDIADSTSRGFFLFFSSPLDGSTVSKRNYNMHTL